MNKKKFKRTSRAQGGTKSKTCDRKDVSRSSDIQNQETNDPAWYAQSPELLRDSSSIPFSWPTGTPLHQCEGQVLDTVPGLATLYLKPTVGSSKDQNSAINVASSAVYSFVRHANSGHSNYDAPDLMIYLLAISQVYSFITWCQRTLGLLMAYDQRNRYIPRAILVANYVDPGDMLNHIADFRFWLNTFINKVSSFAVPATLPIFNRMAFQFSNYYSDGPSIKDQLYEFAPFNLGWFKFSLNDDGVGQLLLEYMPKSSSSGLAVYSDITDYGNRLFNAIWEQEDFGIMSGDILKAYGNNIIKLAPVPEMLVLTPMYDTMFLHQFKNAKIRSLTVEPRVTQNAQDGYLISLLLPDVSTESEYLKRLPLWSGNHILSSDFDNPTPEVVIESTRLMPAWNSVSEWFETGVELPVRVHYMHFTDTGGIGRAVLTDVVDIDTATPETLLQLALIKQFKYAPEVDCTYMDGSNRKYIRYWDIDNYAVLSNDDLEKMHTAALMSMYAVPSIAKIQ